jgi:hypothetical protein
MQTRMSKRALGFLVVAVAVAVAGVAYAAIPGGDGVISGCYAKKTGEFRVIDAEEGAACKKAEKPLSWATGGGIASPDDLAGTPCTIAGRSGQTLLEKPESLGLDAFDTAFEVRIHCAVPDAFEPNDSQAAATAVPFNPGDMLDVDATLFPAGDEDWYRVDDNPLYGFCPEAMVGSADLSWEVYKDGVQVASSADGRDCYPGEETAADWTFRVHGPGLTVYNMFIGV